MLYSGPFQNNNLGYHDAKRDVSAYQVNLTRNVESRTASVSPLFLNNMN
jgi:hypothetical protein